MTTSYGNDSQQHSSAVRQLSESRQKAVEGIQQARLATPQATRHPNLAPDDETTILSLANQRLATYLLQLRPYSDTSGVWDTDLGSIDLPRQFHETSSGQWGSSVRGYETGDKTTYRLTDLNDVISAVNSRVRYSKTGQTGVAESYRVVLTSSQLIEVYEIADKIAREMDFLADIDTPDFSPGGGGAI
jgi:hypothetical protein